MWDFLGSEARGMYRKWDWSLIQWFREHVIFDLEQKNTRRIMNEPISNLKNKIATKYSRDYLKNWKEKKVNLCLFTIIKLIFFYKVFRVLQE